MEPISSISDAELLALMPGLVRSERARSADVIAHLVEIDRRRLFLDQACRSLSCFCIERLGFSEDEAAKRVRVARLAQRFPQALDELRTGNIHLTGLALLAQYVTEENCESLLGAARGLSKRAIEELIATHFPKPDMPQRLSPVPEHTSLAAVTCTGAAGIDPARKIRPGTSSSDAQREPSRLEPLSASRWAVQFTASAELHAKIERARELLSQAIPSGDLATLLERALDELIERETKRLLGAGRPRKRRLLQPGSRHVPLDVMRQVWERDGGRCTFMDEQGRRCTARHFLTVEHREPHALGGPPTVENTCLLCWGHNQHSARQIFGQAHIHAKRAERAAECDRKRRDAFAKVHKALRTMGFSGTQARGALEKLGETAATTEGEPLLRAALALLVPDARANNDNRSNDTIGDIASG